MPLRLLLASVVVLALPALAAAHSSIVIGKAADALKTGDPVWVDPAAIPSIGPSEADELRREIRAAGGGIAVAVMPADALHEARSAEDVLREIARRVGRAGTYAVVVGGQFRAGSSAGPERARVPELADEAFEEHSDQGLAPTLLAFVEAVGEERGGGGDDGGLSPAGAIGLGLAATGVATALGVFVLGRRRRRAAELAEVKEVAEEDLLALGGDIRELDLDVELPGADPRAKEDYGQALTSYERASSAFGRARAPEDLEEVSAALEEGRYAMTSAKARLAGEEPPERRPPCFFDPRHGPSVRDVEWAPPGGEPRLVPACGADAIRVEEGEEPAARNVLVGGRPTPYWNAGPAYAPWASGFFGGAAGSLVPVLFVGSMLGGGWGFGSEDASFDDVGGGDFDFGGGDFGGGDFGGGGGE
jgi:hypothetical protein